MDFEELIRQAKEGKKEAMEGLVEMYKPLLIKNAIMEGQFDEDLYQEYCITLLKSIRAFKI